MDMFQAPTLLEETFSSTSQLHAAEKDFSVERSGKKNSVKSMFLGLVFT